MEFDIGIGIVQTFCQCVCGEESSSSLNEVSLVSTKMVPPPRFGNLDGIGKRGRKLINLGGVDGGVV